MEPRVTGWASLRVVKRVGLYNSICSVDDRQKRETRSTQKLTAVSELCMQSRRCNVEVRRIRLDKHHKTAVKVTSG